MEFGLKDFFVGWLVVDFFDGGGGEVSISKCLVLISPNNCVSEFSPLPCTLRNKGTYPEKQNSPPLPGGRTSPPATGKGVRSEGLLVEQVPPCNGLLL